MLSSVLKIYTCTDVGDNAYITRCTLEAFKQINDNVKHKTLFLPILNLDFVTREKQPF